jgi:hypothetical protein
MPTASYELTPIDLVLSSISVGRLFVCFVCPMEISQTVMSLVALLVFGIVGKPLMSRWSIKLVSTYNAEVIEY